MIVKNQKGEKLSKNIKKEGDLWGANVWSLDANGIGTNERRQYYKIRSEARNAGISEDTGVVNTGPYMKPVKAPELQTNASTD